MVMAAVVLLVVGPHVHVQRWRQQSNILRVCRRPGGGRFLRKSFHQTKLMTRVYVCVGPCVPNSGDYLESRKKKYIQKMNIPAR